MCRRQLAAISRVHRCVHCGRTVVTKSQSAGFSRSRSLTGSLSATAARQLHVAVHRCQVGVLGVRGLRGFAQHEIDVLERRFGVLRAFGDADRGVDDVGAFLRHRPAQRRTAVHRRLRAVARPARHGHVALREQLRELGMLRVERQDVRLELLDQLEARVGVLDVAAGHVGRRQQEERAVRGRDIRHCDLALVGRLPQRHPGVRLLLDLILVPDERLRHVHELGVGIALDAELRIKRLDVGHLGWRRAAHRAPRRCPARRRLRPS